MKAFLILAYFIIGSFAANSLFWLVQLTFGHIDDLDQSSVIVRKLSGLNLRRYFANKTVTESHFSLGTQPKREEAEASESEDQAILPNLDAASMRRSLDSWRAAFKDKALEYRKASNLWENGLHVHTHAYFLDRPSTSMKEGAIELPSTKYGEESQVPPSVLEAFDKYSSSGKAN